MSLAQSLGSGGSLGSLLFVLEVNSRRFTSCCRVSTYDRLLVVMSVQYSVHGFCAMSCALMSGTHGEPFPRKYRYHGIVNYYALLFLMYLSRCSLLSYVPLYVFIIHIIFKKMFLTEYGKKLCSWFLTSFLLFWGDTGRSFTAFDFWVHLPASSIVKSS